VDFTPGNACHITQNVTGSATRTRICAYAYVYEAVCASIYVFVFKMFGLGEKYSGHFDDVGIYCTIQGKYNR
jgi:hypothetical protein